MKILIVGAGALGGYFGGRLLETGADVTYLLRDGRIQQLKESGGLHIKSPFGDQHFPEINSVTADTITEHYDLIILSCKAYALDNCITAIAPAIGENTMILPVLNGTQHIQKLCDKFGEKHVIGGFALISATLDERGVVHHVGRNQKIAFGELKGGNSERTTRIETLFKQASFDTERSDDIMHAMWHKWMMISTAVSTTCLFRGSISDVINAGGTDVILKILNECMMVAKSVGYGPTEKEESWMIQNFSTTDNKLMASLLKDMEKGIAIENEAIINDLINRAPPELQEKLEMLKLVRLHLNTYLERQKRESAES